MIYLNRQARSFVVIMIVLAVSLLILRVIAEKAIIYSCAQNESSAQSSLKVISAALENYAKDNQELYPQDLSVLVKSKPEYLDRDYIAQSPIKGYTYNCSRLEASGYSCYAFPSRCGLTGELAFTVTTGSLFISEDCALKE